MPSSQLAALFIFLFSPPQELQPQSGRWPFILPSQQNSTEWCLSPEKISRTETLFPLLLLLLLRLALSCPGFLAFASLFICFAFSLFLHSDAVLTAAFAAELPGRLLLHDMLFLVVVSGELEHAGVCASGLWEGGQRARRPG